jgi:uncharacterized protein (TIGR00369 family)
LTDEAYGVKTLPDLYKEWSSTGMIANVGTRLVEVAFGKVVLSSAMTAEAHGFPTSRGTIVHGGAVAAIVDQALAAAAFTQADEGQTTVTADLKVDFLRPASPGTHIAKAAVRHRTGRLAFCEGTVEQDGGEIVAEARAVIVYVSS